MSGEDHYYIMVTCMFEPLGDRDVESGGFRSEWVKGERPGGRKFGLDTGAGHDNPYLTFWVEDGKGGRDYYMADAREIAKTVMREVESIEDDELDDDDDLDDDDLLDDDGSGEGEGESPKPEPPGGPAGAHDHPIAKLGLSETDFFTILNNLQRNLDHVWAMARCVHGGSNEEKLLGQIGLAALVVLDMREDLEAIRWGKGVDDG